VVQVYRRCTGLHVCRNSTGVQDYLVVQVYNRYRRIIGVQGYRSSSGVIQAYRCSTVVFVWYRGKG